MRAGVGLEWILHDQDGRARIGYGQSFGHLQALGKLFEHRPGGFHLGLRAHHFHGQDRPPIEATTPASANPGFGGAPPCRDAYSPSASTQVPWPVAMGTLAEFREARLIERGPHRTV